MIWRNLVRETEADCGGLLLEPAALVTALAGRFRQAGSIEDIAARVGAISETEGLVYWSTLEQTWRVLISEAFALDGPDLDSARPNFTATEMMSGRLLYFAQNDTRSTGRNIYTVSMVSAESDRIAFEIVNVTPIRLPFLTLFDAGTLRSLHFIERQGRDIWGYYGIAVVRKGAVQGHEKSFLNRGAAFYRFLIGDPPDRDPPLAP